MSQSSVHPRCGYRKSRIEDNQPKSAASCQRAQPLSDPLCPCRPPSDEERHIGAEQESQPLQLSQRIPQAEKPVQADQHRRRIAATSPQSGAHRYPLPNADGNPLVDRRRLHDQLSGSKSDILPAVRHQGMVAGDLDSRPSRSGAMAVPWELSDFDFVVKGDRQQNRIEQMIAVLAPPHDAQK